MKFLRGVSRQLAEDSCDFCNRGDHGFCEYLLDLERLNHGASDHRDYMIYPVTAKTCLCYRTYRQQHLEDW